MELVNHVLANSADGAWGGYIHPCSPLLGRPQFLACPVFMLTNNVLSLFINVPFHPQNYPSLGDKLYGYPI